MRNLRTRADPEWKCFIRHVKPLKVLLKAHACNANSSMVTGIHMRAGSGQ